MVGIIIIFLITGVSKSKSGDFINGKSNIEVRLQFTPV